MGKNFCSDRDFQSLIQILTIENVYGIIETVTMIVFYTKVIINSLNFRTTIFNSNVYSIAPNLHELFQCNYRESVAFLPRYNIGKFYLTIRLSLSPRNNILFRAIVEFSRISRPPLSFRSIITN